jgi:hypothetical protein
MLSFRPGRRVLLLSFVSMSVLFFVPALARVTDSASVPVDAADATAFGSGIEICTSSVQPVALSNPTTITQCTQARIQEALDVGGHINFDCGPAPITIPIAFALEINTTTDTVLDGGGLVTLDGQNLTRILHKDWHDPVAVGAITVTIQNMRFINGKAPTGGGTGDHSGGVISAGHPGTHLHVINSTFENNATTDATTADNQGGAIFSHNAYETVISGCVFEGNAAGNGGAFGGIATGLFVFNSRFADNHATDTTAGGIVRGYGGAIHLDGVTNSYNPDSNKRVHLCGNTFENNTAIRGGGATVVTVSDNKGTKVTYEKSTFNDNEVFGLDGSYGQGGAIYHIEDDHAGGSGEDNLEISQSTFHGNQAGRQGGAAWLYILGQGDIVNTTFEGNSTSAPFNEVGQGGAMAITLGRINVTNVTFAHNHAAYQAGALHGGSSGDPNRVITLKNTIFYSNTLNEQELPTPTRWQGYHTNRPLADGGQNIQFPRLKPTYDNDVNNNITENPIYADPLLEPLADNGGFNLTMALREGSLAIDAGAAGCPDTDQRGVARAGQCDIGAYEYVASAAPTLSASPIAQAVPPGGVATYQVQASPPDSFTYTLALTVTHPYTHLIVSLVPATITSSQVATLTVADTHTGTSLLPGLWHTLVLTAAGGDLALSTQVNLLVGGVRVYLPLVVSGTW